MMDINDQCWISIKLSKFFGAWCLIAFTVSSFYVAFKNNRIGAKNPKQISVRNNAISYVSVKLSAGKNLGLTV